MNSDGKEMKDMVEKGLMSVDAINGEMGCVCVCDAIISSRSTHNARITANVIE